MGISPFLSESVESPQRLIKRADFLAASKSIYVWKRPAFVMQLNLNAHDKPYARVGFTVTKRQGNAVIRNRVKRRLREAVRLSLPQYLKPHCDYVFIGRVSAASIEFSQLKNEMIEAVKRLHHKIETR